MRGSHQLCGPETDVSSFVPPFVNLIRLCAALMPQQEKLLTIKVLMWSSFQGLSSSVVIIENLGFPFCLPNTIFLQCSSLKSLCESTAYRPYNLPTFKKTSRPSFPWYRSLLRWQPPRSSFLQIASSRLRSPPCFPRFHGYSPQVSRHICGAY